MEKMPSVTVGDHSVISILDEANDDLIINEWESFFSQQPSTSVGSQRIRRIEKVPQILRGFVDDSNQKDFDPVVVSFGPYHHGKTNLHLAEEFKRTSLRIYASYCDGKSIEYLRNKVLDVIGDVRACYGEDSTNEYDDEKFAEMMLLDGCLLLVLMEWKVRPISNWLLACEHLGALGYVHLYGDVFLLENQLPFKLLHVLMTIRFDKQDTRNEIIHFLHIYFSRVLTIVDDQESNKLKDTIIDQNDKLHQPLHLLEIGRACILLLRWGVGVGFGISNKEKHNSAHEDLREYARSFRSVTEIKAKGIFTSKSQTRINFKSGYLYGKLEIPPMLIAQATKSYLLNLIAYEMCPNNPNDFGVTSYVRFMKMLIQHADDVKELRTNNILHNFLGKDDEEVVTMFKDIIAPPVNVSAFQMVKDKIQNHYNSTVRTLIAELIAKYLNKPWEATALLAAAVLLVSTLAQTYFTIYPRKW